MHRKADYRYICLADRLKMCFYKHLWMISACCIFFSCTDPLQERIDYALQQAGENAPELKKVLDHYQHQPEKLKAARFLIANMPAHRTYVGKEIDSLKQMKKESIKNGPISKETVERWKLFDYSALPAVRDVNVMKADALIENIDLAFEVWEKRPWSRQYSFEDFCEYVLPYRVGDEPFENWRRIYYDRYSPVLDSLYQGNDVAEAARVIADYLKKEKFTKYMDFTLPHLGALFLLENRVGYCRENCDIASYAMRALGIPVTMDFYEMSPSYNSRHFWSALIDTTGFVLPFNYMEDRIARPPQDKRKRGKVYRFFYGLQPERFTGLYADKGVPAFFRHALMKDVGDEYFPEGHVQLKTHEEPATRWGYLCTFTGRELKPIDISEFRGKKIEFANVEPNLIYFPTVREEGIMKVFNYPFLLKDNLAEYFIPDTARKCSVTLTRKYPLRTTPAFLATSVGVKIEGANRKDFRDAELLYQVVDTPRTNYNVLYPSVQKRFRYVRYSAPKRQQIELGEWYIYDKNTGEVIVPEEIWGNPPLRDEFRDKLKYMTDGDWATFYYSRRWKEQLMFDLGTPQFIGSFLLMPRNDDNFIHLGDLYELFYHAGSEGWISLGKQTADSLELHYDGVPEGALLWLRNHTRGKEERCFYMRDGKQIFI